MENLDIICERGYQWVGVLSGWKLDLANGTSDDFEIVLPEMNARDVDGSLMIQRGDYLFVPDTDWGGVVDYMTSDNTSGHQMVGFRGRTWRGILASKVTRPDAGQDYLTVSGTLKSCISVLISKYDLGSAFEVVGANGPTVDFKFDRFINLMQALESMCKEYGYRIDIRKNRGKALISAIPADPLDQGFDENFVRYVMSKNFRPVNHLVCAGKGELKDRVIVDLYADDAGNVSKVQTLFGVDEVSELYDRNNEEADKLEEEGTKKLVEYQEKSTSVDLQATEDFIPNIGDVIVARSVVLGMTASAQVTEIIVTARHNSKPTIGYNVGSAKIGGK